jgi:hypothetical protein
MRDEVAGMSKGGLLVVKAPHGQVDDCSRGAFRQLSTCGSSEPSKVSTPRRRRNLHALSAQFAAQSVRGECGGATAILG